MTELRIARTNHRYIYVIVAAVIAAAHMVLFALDLRSDAGFFRADRVDQRLSAMNALIESAHSWNSFVSALPLQGNIGDYGIQALLFANGGYISVILFQLLLAIPAGVCVIYIALQATDSPKVAMVSGLLFGLLPQTLAFPHQLLSEAISNPLLIVGTALFILAQRAYSKSSYWIASGVCLGLAGMARPALILLPMISATLLALLDRRQVRNPRLAAFLAASFVPLVLWGLFMLAQLGTFGFGPSNQDLGINFSQSTAKVLLSEGQAPADGTAPAWLPVRLSLSEYFGFVAKYPKGFANLYAKNTLVLLADSGIGRLYVDLLGFGTEARLALQDPVYGWRAQLTNNGPMAMLKHGMSIAPGTIIAGVTGALGFLVVNIGLAGSYFALLRRSSPILDVTKTLVERWTLSFLLLIPPYVLTTSQVVAYAPSRLRSQGEFAWAILACIGWVYLAGRMRTKHVRSSSPLASDTASKD